MRRGGHVMSVVALVCGAVGFSTPAPVAAGSGGRVHLVQPVRVFSGRVGGNSVLTNAPVSGLVKVTVYATEGAVVASVGGCASADGAVPAAVVDNAQLVYFEVAASPSQCVWTSGPASVAVDQLGTISTQPDPALDQYVPAASPQVIFDGKLASWPWEFDLTPADANDDAWVFAVEAAGSNTDVVVQNCSYTPLSGPLFPDVNPTQDGAIGLSFDPVDKGSATTRLCLEASPDVQVRVTLLGTLRSDGPDPTRLPPVVTLGVVDVAPPGLVATSPQRVFDSRTKAFASSGKVISSGAPIAARTAMQLDTSNFGNSTSNALVMNVTVTEPQDDGFLTVYPCDTAQPVAASLTYRAGQTISNQVVVKLSSDEELCFFTYATTHVVVDLSGSFDSFAGAGVHPVVPVRVEDTRVPIGWPPPFMPDGKTPIPPQKLPGGQPLALQIAGRNDVPASGVDSITMNVTVANPDGDGFVTVYPCDHPRPVTASLTYAKGQTIGNLVTAKLSSDGKICFYTYASTDIVADLSAWYSPSEPAGFHELNPDRLLDTRNAIGTPTTSLLAKDGVLVLHVAGRSGVPASGANAVTMNVTVTQPAGPGFVTAYPCDQPRPTAANLAFVAGQTISNLVTVKLSSAGTVCLYSMTATHLVADVAGYFTDEPDQAIMPVFAGA